MHRSLLTKSSVCCINHTSNPSFRKHTKCASTNFLHLSSSAPNSPIHWSLGSFVSGHAQQIFFFFGCCFSSSSFFFSVVVVVVVLLLPQNIGVLESHSTSNNDVSFPAFFPFFRLFHTFFFLSPPLPHEESLLLSSSTTSSRALKKSSHDDDDDDDESKNISVASSSFFPISLSLFFLRQK